MTKWCPECQKDVTLEELSSTNPITMYICPDCSMVLKTKEENVYPINNRLVNKKT